MEADKRLQAQKKVYEMETIIHRKDHELESIRRHVKELKMLLQDQQRQSQPPKSFIRLHQNAFQNNSKAIESPIRQQRIETEPNKGSGCTSSSSSSSTDSIDFSKLSPIRRQSLLMGEESLSSMAYMLREQQQQQHQVVMSTPIKPLPRDPVDSFLYSPEADSKFLMNPNMTFLSSLASPNRSALSSSSGLMGEELADMLPSKARVLANHSHHRSSAQQHDDHDQYVSNEYKSLNAYISSVEPTLFDLANSSL